MEDDKFLEECMTYVPPLMCFACEHFNLDRSRHYPSTRRGECRRLSPAVIDTSGDVEAFWPMVSELDWCGDGLRKNID
jgi:hypothetical protein